MQKKSILMGSILGVACSLAISCSSKVKMADIPATADPREEVTKLSNDLNSAVGQNIDVLAADEYRKSRDFLGKAKMLIENEKPQSDSLDALRKSRGYLQQAYSVSENRESKAEGLFAARQMALKAGAATQSELRSDLTDLDSEVSSKADKLIDVDSDKLAGYQKRYVDLERRSVILTQLGKTQALVNGTKKDGAQKKAPLSFRKAELSLRTAESMISSNVRNPDGFADAVAKAKRDGNQLMKVMAVIQKNGKDLDESVAIKMVGQDTKIAGLNHNLDQVSAQGAANQSEMESRNQKLSDQVASGDQKIAAANRKARVQVVLEKARSQFSETEAEAYQQGENLVIRLKQVNFASGRSDLPANSISLLSKVSDVAKSLNPSQIVVEGHTDSIGTATANNTLSEQRAIAVATFFKSNGFSDIKVESEGFGFKKPIATNKSKEGRAQNRRVDIVITPEVVTE